jgi:hypothetical protein
VLGASGDWVGQDGLKCVNSEKSCARETGQIAYGNNLHRILLCSRRRHCGRRPGTAPKETGCIACDRNEEKDLAQPSCGHEANRRRITGRLRPQCARECFGENAKYLLSDRDTSLREPALLAPHCTLTELMRFRPYGLRSVAQEAISRLARSRTDEMGYAVVPRILVESAAISVTGILFI